MNRAVILCSILILIGIASRSQEIKQYPFEVIQQVYHDCSIALKDMPLIPPGSGGMRWENHEVPNKISHVWPIKEQTLPMHFSERDPALQDFMGSNVPITTILDFEGLAGNGSVVPPDPNGAVGSNHFIETVNMAFAIYSKEGSLVYGPASMATFWYGYPGCYSGDGDPIVLFDHLANRWILSEFALPNYPNGPYYEMVAISQTDDPLGAWYRYSFQFSSMPDYPKLGIWNDGYYLSVNSYSSGALAYIGPVAAVLERDSMLVGNSARMVKFQLSDSANFMNPADLDGPAPTVGTPGYFVAFTDESTAYEPNQLLIYELQVDWANPSTATLEGPTALPIAPFDPAIDEIPQKGTSRKLDVLPQYLMHRLPFRYFGNYQSMLLNHSVDADGNDHAGIRWYELRKSNETWTVYQQGTYSPDSKHRWMGSIAMDYWGNIALGYSVMSDSIYASIGLTGQHAGDPPGTLTSFENIYLVGGGAQTGESRWGDYSSMSIDPTDNKTFWYTNQYYSTTNSIKWNTHVAKFTINDLPVSIADKDKNVHDFVPETCYPNPCSVSTLLKWHQRRSGQVTIELYDIRGAKLAHFPKSFMTAGDHQLILDVSSFSSGAYMVNFTFENKSYNKKLILIR